jgi:flagellar P-ring protein FlgI
MRRWSEDVSETESGALQAPAGVGRVPRGVVIWTLALALLLASVAMAQGQEARVRDLTVAAGDIPVRLVGYGLVVGLDGTGDRVIGGFSAGHTVRSVANLLRRFNVEVPENMLRTRNVAAVLVTAEASPYLRPGGRFDVHVASVGDAVSLRGGVLWITPLQAGPATAPVATAQGALLVAEPTDARAEFAVETTAVLPEGGLLEQAMAVPDFASTSTLLLRHPNIATASRIVEAINSSLGAGTAQVEDPGSITFQMPSDSSASFAQRMTSIGELTVRPERAARVIIDGRAGTVIAGGGIRIGEAVVSHGAMTLAIGGSPAGDTNVPGDLRIAEGATVQDVAAALHGVAAPPQAIAAVFESLRQVGALTAEVTIR